MKVAAMIQSAMVRQRLFFPSLRPMAAIVSEDSCTPSRVERRMGHRKACPSRSTIGTKSAL